MRRHGLHLFSGTNLFGPSSGRFNPNDASDSSISKGLNEDRIKMVFVSAAEGDKFAAEVNKLADEIRKIGPNPSRLWIHHICESRRL
ncbi:MAG: hydrogenase iron-sulfur subunit [Candidatus Thorarchaeota archaeon]